MINLITCQKGCGSHKVIVNMEYPALKIVRKTGNEQLSQNGTRLERTVLDFWRWSASDLVSNTLRGIFAEYIVATALGLDTGVRNEWDAFDLLTTDNIKIEVKSAAYLQTWYHQNLSSINFNIRPTRAWDAETNTSEPDLKRQADIYVFCLLKHQDKLTLDPLNLDQWEFYIVPASHLNEKILHQRTLSLSKLIKLNPQIVSYEKIAQSIMELSNSIVAKEFS